MADLQVADAAGDTALAQHIAGRIKAARIPAAPTSPGESLLARLARGVGTLGSSAAAGAQSLGQVADPLMAAAGTAGSYLVPYTGTGSVGERFKNEMENIRRTREERYKASPNAFGAGAILIGAGAGPALAKMAPLSAGAPAGPGAAALLTRAGAGVGDAALANAASQAASNLDRDPLGAAAEAATSPGNLIGALPAAAPAMGDALRAVGRAAGRGAISILPKTQPSAAALLLRKEGAPLTLGQNNPDSFYAAFEQASADSPLGMHLEQGAAKDAYRTILQNQTRAPGTPPVRGGTTQGNWKEILRGFNEGYAPFGEHPVAAEIVRRLPEQATSVTDMPGIDARTRGAVRSEIENALTVLPERAPYEPGPGGQFGKEPPLPDMTTGDLMKVRANIREQARAALNDPDKQRLFGLAEDAITSAIERSMPAGEADKLRAIDRQYAKTMTLMKAAPAGQTDFTPNQAARALEHDMGRRAFKSGAAGDLQDIVQAGQEVFDTRVKPTGMRSAILSVMPAKFAGAGARYLNQPEIKASLLGETYAAPPAPRSVTPEQARVLALVAALRRPPSGAAPFEFQPVPTMAEDDRR